MLPILEDNEDDDIDAWNDPNEAQRTDLLSKYDDVEDMALKKKRANRMQIGGAKQTAAPAEKKAKAREEENSNNFSKKQIGSDYYATLEEDPLLASSTMTSFRKKKS